MAAGIAGARPNPDVPRGGSGAGDRLARRKILTASPGRFGGPHQGHAEAADGLAPAAEAVARGSDPTCDAERTTEIQLRLRGKMHECDESTVFQVGRKPLQPKVQLRRYYMQQYVRLVTQIQSVIDEGPAALARHLSAPEWERLNVDSDELGLEPEGVKMMIVLEAIFEQVRLKSAPSLPSRMNCVFTWPSLELARRFRIQYVPGGTIHRCRVIEGLAVELDGGLLPPGINLVDLSPSALSHEVRATRARAEKYWNAPASPDFPELLIVGSVEVVDPVNDQ